MRRRRRNDAPRRRDDAPYPISTRDDLKAAVEEHKLVRGCSGDSAMFEETCPCGTKVLVMCASCETAVIMMVRKGRRCAHEMVYHLDDGTTFRPFEGY